MYTASSRNIAVEFLWTDKRDDHRVCSGYVCHPMGACSFRFERYVKNICEELPDMGGWGGGGSRKWAYVDRPTPVSKSIPGPLLVGILRLPACQKFFEPLSRNSQISHTFRFLSDIPTRHAGYGRAPTQVQQAASARNATSILRSSLRRASRKFSDLQHQQLGVIL